VAEAGVTVSPAGVEDGVRVTVPVKPPEGVTETEKVPLPPVVKLMLLGLAANEKSGVGGAPQPGNLKEPMRVFQLNEPLTRRYSLVYQKVQSSTGSSSIAL
jgi:hypothetical protein